MSQILSIKHTEKRNYSSNNTGKQDAQTKGTAHHMYFVLFVSPRTGVYGNLDISLHQQRIIHTIV